MKLIVRSKETNKYLSFKTVQKESLGDSYVSTDNKPFAVLCYAFDNKEDATQYDSEQKALWDIHDSYIELEDVEIIPYDSE